MDTPLAAATDLTRQDYPVSKRYAWFVFALTFLLMLFDFIDRQIVVSMFPVLKAEWNLSDTQLGALVSVVALTVGLGAVPVALLADRWSRVKSIFVMATIWSLATIACSFAGNYTQLFAARSVIGIGEAGYGPVGGALLASLFPSRLRASILGAFTAAATVGGVLGVVLGGVISARWGWQAAFGIVGVPGLLLALCYLLVRDYRTVALVDPAAGSASEKMGAWKTAAALFRAPSSVAAYVGAAMQLFLVSTLYAWLPSYLNRAYDLPPDKAGIKAAIVLLVGSLGAAVWGLAADRISRKRPRNKFKLMAFCCAATFAVLTFAFGWLPAGDAQFLAIVVGGFVMTGTLGTAAAVAMDVVHSGLRSTAVAMITLAQNLLGLAAGPLISGALSDAYGLSTALTVMPGFCLLAAVAFLLGARTYERDLQNVDQTAVTFEPRAKTTV